MLKINEFLEIKDAAKFLGVCAETLRNWEKRGKLKVYRNPINNYRLYKLEDLKEFLNMMNLPGN